MGRYLADYRHAENPEKILHGVPRERRSRHKHGGREKQPAHPKNEKNIVEQGHLRAQRAANDEIAAEKNSRHERHNIAERIASGKTVVPARDYGAARQNDQNADHGPEFYLLFQNYNGNEQNHQRVKGKQHRRAGYGSVFHRREPAVKVAEQEQPGNNARPDVLSRQSFVAFVSARQYGYGKHQYGKTQSVKAHRYRIHLDDPDEDHGRRARHRGDDDEQIYIFLEYIYF